MRNALEEVAFVVDPYQGFALAYRHQLVLKLCVAFLFRLGTVSQQQDDIGLRGLLEGTLDSHLFYGVVGFAYAGGVDEAEQRAIDDGGVLDAVACGTLNVAY